VNGDDERSAGRRLEKLESEVRRLRKQMERRKTAKFLKSRQIELVDEGGRTRVVLELDAEDPVVRIVDRDGLLEASFRFAGGELLREEVPVGDDAPRWVSSIDKERDEAAAPAEPRETEEAVPREKTGKPEAAPEPEVPLPERVAALHPWFHAVTVGDVKVVPGIGSTVAAETLERQTAARATLLVDAVAERYGFSDKTILDLGCGEGYWSARYAEKGASRVFGVEGRRRFIEQAELYYAKSGVLPRGRYRFLEGNVSDPKAWEEIRAAGPFDLALLAGILHHVPNYRDVLSWTADVTRDALVVDTRVGDAAERVVEEPGDLLFNAIEATRAKVVPHLPNLLAHLESLGFEAEVLPVGFPSGPGLQHADSYETGRRVALFARRR
jgi:SAM-dependent methyltransferase